MEEATGAQMQEKNKEKFKYEMTEILFELKGQFAKYQGEKIDYTESKVFAEELQTKVMKLSAEPVPEISCQSFADDQKWDKPVEKARVPKLDFPSISLKKEWARAVDAANVKEVPAQGAPAKRKWEKEIETASVEKIPAPVEREWKKKIEMANVKKIAFPATPAKREWKKEIETKNVPELSYHNISLEREWEKLVDKVEIETIPYPEISVEWMQKELAEIKVEAEFSLKEENMQALFDVSTQGLEAAMKELAKIIWAND